MRDQSCAVTPTRARTHLLQLCYSFTCRELSQLRLACPLEQTRRASSRLTIFPHSRPRYQSAKDTRKTRADPTAPGLWWWWRRRGGSGFRMCRLRDVGAGLRAVFPDQRANPFLHRIPPVLVLSVVWHLPFYPEPDQHPLGSIGVGRERVRDSAISAEAVGRVGAVEGQRRQQRGLNLQGVSHQREEARGG